MCSDSIKADIARLTRICERILILKQKANFRVDKGEEVAENGKLRMKTVQLVKAILKPLMMSSVIDYREYQTIAATITDLAKNGKSARLWNFGF